jgi:hypothetical protein
MDTVADWWLGMPGAVLGEVAAAAAPATTIVSAKMRMASFMVGNLRWIWLDRRRLFCMLES